MKKILFLSLTLLLAFTAVTFAQTAVPSSDEIMTKAYARAKKENKKVMVIFHASWCGWCKKMEASINEPNLKKFFDDNYVVVYLTVQESKGKENLENPGALDLMTKYKGDKAGLPFWFITDVNGKALADSQERPAGAGLDTYGDNVGCPASEKEVAYFAKILKSTSKLNDKEIAMISERFAKNKE
ncbi:thioredoxin family protein [Mucilaginibacter auburnensis]|uniref:Thioredoxin-like protein n=1 Tax=Mucilaginibacter auburnensis TaxID=1457233 RepID=A0A2H9VW82_9SPHI|nr:thioredoxin family protein [Mucilaginibacter auburnensis]PJJ85080.1 thioredoxin-like protein [Mucilaginibacter auburnensis]